MFSHWSPAIYIYMIISCLKAYSKFCSWFILSLWIIYTKDTQTNRQTQLKAWPPAICKYDEHKQDTHTQPFYCSSGICPGPPGWAGTRKVKPGRVKPIWIYWSKRQWAEVASVGLYASLHLIPDNHANIPPLSFLQASCPSCRPTSSIKALKEENKIAKLTKIPQGRLVLVQSSTDISTAANMHNLHKTYM